MFRARWRSTLISITITALAAVQCVSPAGAAPARAGGGSALSVVPATTVIVFHPKGSTRMFVSGSCDMGESVALDRADAWRCIVGNVIYDPCFSAAPHATSVICGATPSKPIGITVKLPKALPTHAPAHGGQAWIVRLGDGSTCEFLTGATFGVGGQRVNYGCSDKNYLVGDPIHGRVWLAVKAQISSKPGPNGPTAGRVWAVSVATAWM